MKATKPEQSRWATPMTSEKFDGWMETLIFMLACLLFMVLQALWLAR